MLKRTVKHFHNLRVFFLLFFSVVFMSALGLNPVSVVKFIGSEAGLAVGMDVGVPENPINRVAKELREKEEFLNKKEKSLDDREAEISKAGKKQDILIVFLGVGLWALFILIGINFYIDYKKRKNISKDLRILRIGRENTYIKS